MTGCGQSSPLASTSFDINGSPFAVRYAANNGCRRHARRLQFLQQLRRFVFTQSNQQAAGCLRIIAYITQRFGYRVSKAHPCAK